jgi:ubiquinone biosynthesis protein
VKDISGGKLLKQLFDVTEKFNMQTQPQLLMLQKNNGSCRGSARKLNLIQIFGQLQNLSLKVG